MVHLSAWSLHFVLRTKETEQDNTGRKERYREISKEGQRDVE